MYLLHSKVADELAVYLGQLMKLSLSPGNLLFEQIP